MTAFEQIAQLKEQVNKLQKEKLELVEELNFKCEIEKEAVRRYDKVSSELLMYYIKYGKLDKKGKKKK
jgi:hypothetical protein